MTEEDYFEILDRIVKGAEYLDNPLIKKEHYERGMILYEKLYEKARDYRQSLGGEVPIGFSIEKEN